MDLEIEFLRTSEGEQDVGQGVDAWCFGLRWRDGDLD